MLEMPSSWRFGNPGELSMKAMDAFHDLILKITVQGNSWLLLEHFKSCFGGASTSSSESWAGSDLYEASKRSRSNAPAFIAAFWTGVQALRGSHPQLGLPDEHNVNSILVDCGEPYELRPPKLLPRQSAGSPVVNVPEASLDEKARTLIQTSLSRADNLLAHQHPRQAVQEILWLLETVSTAFDGRETSVGAIEGKYFNSIVREIIKHGDGAMLGEVGKWMSKIHGYLSSPSGGGVRHGTKLDASVEIQQHEARLYCNLTKSYIDYLLAELAQMPTAVRPPA
jgi:hypothetical protein